jgi:hypothetical protein
MNYDRSPTPELQTLVEQLGSGDSCLTAEAAEAALAERGEAGIAAMPTMRSSTRNPATRQLGTRRPGARGWPQEGARHEG